MEGFSSRNQPRGTFVLDPNSHRARQMNQARENKELKAKLEALAERLAALEKKKK